MIEEMNQKTTECRHCGADYYLHRADDNACPANGQRSCDIGEGHWLSTVFEEGGVNGPMASITKREYFAVMAMQGYITPHIRRQTLWQRMVLFFTGKGNVTIGHINMDEVAMSSVKQADKLLNQLSK